MIAALKDIFIHATVSLIFVYATVWTVVWFGLNLLLRITPGLSMRIGLWIIGIVLLILYLGLLPTLALIVIFTGTVLIGQKFLKFTSDPLLGLVIGLFILIEAWALIALLLSPFFALWAIGPCSGLLIIYQWRNPGRVLSLIEQSIRGVAHDLNAIEVWLLTVCFLVGSQPQSFWDAVQANLYVAKWYIQTNSLAHLPEAISSLFPQNAIVYYSLFYQIAGMRGVHLAIFLPVLLLVIFAKRIVRAVTQSHIMLLLVYGLIVTPMVVFQGSNGYYDLLVVTVLLIALYILHANPEKKTERNVLIAAFLIGFDAAVKYFPAAYIFLPGLVLLRYQNGQRRIISVLLGTIILGVAPLIVWLLRSFAITHSAVYPFLQNYFPTPDFWPSNDILEQSPMMATAMSTFSWIKGGFLTYPLETFFKTEFFLETVKGFPGAIYILLIPCGIFSVGRSMWRIWQRRSTQIDLFLIYTAAAYLIIGAMTRYYRYLWPYQFLFGLFVILSLTDILTRKWIKIGVFIAGLAMLICNVFLIKRSFTFYPIFKERLLTPDYYLLSKTETDPVLFLNHQTRNSPAVKILDVSKYLPGRYNFAGRVYQCNWYWVNITKVMPQATIDPTAAAYLLKEFDYVIASNPIRDDAALCKDLLPNNLLFPVYVDTYYNVYKVIK